ERSGMPTELAYIQSWRKFSPNFSKIIFGSDAVIEEDRFKSVVFGNNEIDEGPVSVDDAVYSIDLTRNQVLQSKYLTSEEKNKILWKNSIELFERLGF
ncbi:MAG: hypothetical protein KDD50_10160, partial [Bdellovibrionales bacterium]|nr:hypothetical protein [Bdellovibrionales bacterium]